MVDAAIQSELETCLSKLPIDQQRLVLAFARTLTSQAATGTRGSHMLKFEHAIDEADLNQLANAIDEECSRVDPREW